MTEAKTPADIRTRADKRERNARFKDYVKRKKPSYKQAVAYAVLVLGYSRRSAIETIETFLDGDVMVVARDEKGKPLRDGKLKVIDGAFYAEMAKIEEAMK